MKIFLNESIYNLILLEGARVDVLRDKYVVNGVEREKDVEKIPNDIFNKFVEADPSNNKEFVQWLCEIYLMGNLKLEDLYKATNYLKVYSRIRGKLSGDQKNIYTLSNTKIIEKDIINKKGNKATKIIKLLEIDSLQHLLDIIKPFMERREHLTIKEKLEADTLVGETSKWKIYIPKTHEQSCLLGSGTEWCTAHGETSEYFDDYNNTDDLVILINKTNKSLKFQWHKDSRQFMDAADSEVDLKEFLSKDVELSDWFITNNLLYVGMEVDVITSNDKLFNKYKERLKSISIIEHIFEHNNINSAKMFDFYLSEINPNINIDLLLLLLDTKKQFIKNISKESKDKIQSILKGEKIHYIRFRNIDSPYFILPDFTSYILSARNSEPSGVNSFFRFLNDLGQKIEYFIIDDDFIDVCAKHQVFFKKRENYITVFWRDNFYVYDISLKKPIVCMVDHHTLGLRIHVLNKKINLADILKKIYLPMEIYHKILDGDMKNRPKIVYDKSMSDIVKFLGRR